MSHYKDTTMRGTTQRMCKWMIKGFTVSSSFIHSVFCLTTGPEPPPKRFLHIVRSRASSFKWEYPLLSLRSSSSFLHLLPSLFVTFISPFIFPSITCFRRQFLRKMQPIQLAFRFLISCRIRIVLHISSKLFTLKRFHCCYMFRWHTADHHHGARIVPG
jgi:hypothetical protein